MTVYRRQWRLRQWRPLFITPAKLQTSFLTPPFGFALFFLKGGLAPPQINMLEIYRGVVPLVAFQLLVIGSVLAAPEIAIWLFTEVPSLRRESQGRLAEGAQEMATERSETSNITIFM